MTVCNKPEHLDPAFNKMLNEKKTNIKCVIVGDAMVGKTSLARRLACLGFAMDYNPTTFDNYVVTTTMGGKAYVLSLFDTAGQEEYIHLRALSYVNCDVFLLCFSVATPESLQQTKDKWLPELHRFSPDTPIVLVATQVDRRDYAPEKESMPLPAQPTTNLPLSPSDIPSICLSNHPLPSSYTSVVSSPASNPLVSSSVASTRRGSGSTRKNSLPVVSSRPQPKCLSTKDGHQAAIWLNADGYAECSSLTEVGIDCLREKVIEHGLRRPDPRKKRGCNCSCVVL